MVSIRYGVVAACLGLALGTATTFADTWPSKPVRFIVPFAPGGAADTLARSVSDHLSQSLHQSFVIDNRPGAGGLLGQQAGATAEPDGYTFVISGIASTVVAPAMSPRPGFDSVRDFSHVAHLGGPPLVLLVHPSLGVKTFEEFVAAVRKSPDGLGYVSAGTGTHGHLFGEYLAKKENLKLQHVPYRGSAPALNDLIGGHVKVGAMAWVSAAEQIRSGLVRVIAVSSAERMPNDLSVPTFKELGYPDLVAATWFGISGPAGVPREIVQRMHAAVAETLQRDDVKKRFAEDGVLMTPMTPDEFSAFVAAEVAKWQPVARTLSADAK
jgi:tripartite-type tricarboxylate transporter receptor subunit TctC